MAKPNRDGLAGVRWRPPHVLSNARAQESDRQASKLVHWSGARAEKTPLQRRGVAWRHGVHRRHRRPLTDIKAHTKHVLDGIQNGSRESVRQWRKSKVNVYLHDLMDYAGMNEVFLGCFGQIPGPDDDRRAGRNPWELAGRDRLYRLSLTGPG
jgi:hypothetical protein